MHLDICFQIIMRLVKRMLIVAILVPSFAFGFLSQSFSASADRAGGALLERLFSHGKGKQVEAENVQLAPTTDTRVTELQQQVRELTGKMEELNFMVLQMQEQIRQLQTGASASTSQSVQSTQAVPSHGSKSEIETRQGGVAEPSTRGSFSSGEVASNNDEKTIDPQEAPKDLGSIKFDKNGNVLSGSVNTDGGQTPPQTITTTAEVPQTASSKELYDMGYKNILSGDYRTAEAVFRAFQERYPADPQIADASFWLGESLFGQKRYREAAQVYIDVQRNYKDTPRGPENLLKLGMSMSRLDEQKVACATFSEVTKRYKTVDPAVLKRVKDEQSRNKCQQ